MLLQGRPLKAEPSLPKDVGLGECIYHETPSFCTIHPEKRVFGVEEGGIQNVSSSENGSLQIPSGPLWFPRVPCGSL